MADINIPISESKKEIHKKMIEAVAQAKGDLQGTDEEGTFEIPIALGTIKGKYWIKDGNLEVDVTDKPFLVSKKMIKQALTDFLEKSNN